jgi:hypothetical protein
MLRVHGALNPSAHRPKNYDRRPDQRQNPLLQRGLPPRQPRLLPDPLRLHRRAPPANPRLQFPNRERPTVALLQLRDLPKIINPEQPIPRRELHSRDLAFLSGVIRDAQFPPIKKSLGIQKKKPRNRYATNPISRRDLLPVPITSITSNPILPHTKIRVRVSDPRHYEQNLPLGV